MSPVTPVGPTFQKPGLPVNAASTDNKTPAVQGTSYAGNITSDPVTPTAFGAAVGMIGTSGSGIGVQGSSTSGTGMQGTSNTADGVQGRSAGGGRGVYGNSKGFDAVVGETNSDAHAGVTGRNLTSGANAGVGVYGTGGQYGGKFDGLLVNGNADVANGTLTVIAGSAPYAIGTIGDIHVDGDVLLTGADCAEEFEIVAAAEIDPGTVMVLTEDGALEMSRSPYDKRVAGVISGAGDYRPGLILDKRGSSSERMPLALVGKVYCKIDAQYAPVEIGDLLTTSPTPGHAMRVTDPPKAFGAVIGKALRGLDTGKGLIPILVALQ